MAVYCHICSGATARWREGLVRSGLGHVWRCPCTQHESTGPSIGDLLINHEIAVSRNATVRMLAIDSHRRLVQEFPRRLVVGGSPLRRPVSRSILRRRQSMPARPIDSRCMSVHGPCATGPAVVFSSSTARDPAGCRSFRDLQQHSLRAVMRAGEGIRVVQGPDQGTARDREGIRERSVRSRRLRSPASGETSPRTAVDIKALMPLTAPIPADRPTIRHGSTKSHCAVFARETGRRTRLNRSAVGAARPRPDRRVGRGAPASRSRERQRNRGPADLSAVTHRSVNSVAQIDSDPLTPGNELELSSAASSKPSISSAS